MQIGHILGQNGLWREFYIKKCKISLWLSEAKHWLKTMFPRRLTVFCKLVIVSFVMGFNKNLKVRGPKCGFDERHQKTRWKRRLRVLCKLAIFLVLTGISEIFTVRAPNWRSHDKQEKQAEKDYCEVSEDSETCILQIGHQFLRNGVQQEC